MPSDEIRAREIARVKYHNERASKLGLPATLTIEQWLATLDCFQWGCAYCSARYEDLEHFIPLSLQGETSVSNCIPSCFSCNARKIGKHPSTLSWLAPSTLLYIRSYFVSLHTGEPIAPVAIPEWKDEQREVDPALATYTIKDIANWIRVSENTVKRMIGSGELQGIQIDGIWKFEAREIRHFLDSHQRTKGKGSIQ